MEPNEEKAKSKSVSLLPALWERIEKKASDEYGSNRSDYIRSLVERDLDGAFAPDSPKILFDLIKLIHPSHFQRVKKLWEKSSKVADDSISQAEFLAKLLDAAIEAAEAGRLNLAHYQAFAVIGGRDWLSLSDAIYRGDWATATTVLRRIDPSRDTTPASPAPPQSSAGVLLTPSEQAITEGLEPPAASPAIAFTSPKPKKSK